MNDRLTPKPGDWVMVDGRQFDDGKNRFGTVVERGAYASGDEVTVELDVSFEVRVDGEQDTRGFRVDELQVVDRKPVEWPEVPCWKFGDYNWVENERESSRSVWGVHRHTPHGTQVSINGVAMATCAIDARLYSEAWAYIAEHWDELTGDAT